MAHDLESIRVPSGSQLLSTFKIAVIGMGYVGLPLAVALARHHAVTGHDHVSSIRSCPGAIAQGSGAGRRPTQPSPGPDAVYGA